MKAKYYLPLASILMVSFTLNAQRESRERSTQPARQERSVDRTQGPRVERQEPTRRQEPQVRDTRTQQPPTRETRVVREPRVVTPQTGQPQTTDRRNDNTVRNNDKRTDNNNDRRVDPNVGQQRVDRTAGVDRNDNNRIRRDDNNRVDRNNNNRDFNNSERQRRDPIVARNSPQQRQPYVPVSASRNNPMYNYHTGYRPDYRRPYSYIGVRYTNFYRPRFYTPYLGINYYYSGGFFYSPFDTYYQVVYAPVGIHIYSLPWGYRRFWVGPTLYYYYGGTYYRNYNTYYEVVETPMGSIVPELPQDAATVVIDGHKYYEKSGTYYQETKRGDETWYTVVGKNGKLDTNVQVFKEDATEAAVGDVVSELPDDYKTVVLNNQKYYVANETYYQEQIANNTISYKVVAKPQ